MAEWGGVSVAVDVMGTDTGPARMIEGVRLALDAVPDLRCVVVGEEEQIAAAFVDGLPQRVELQYAAETIAMGEDPAVAVRAKRDSSLLRAMQLARSGTVDAVVTAANTGAVVLAAAAVLGRLPGVLHPALASIVASGSAGSTLVDCGASPRREAVWLAQYGVLGAAAAVSLYNHRDPPVGLLSNGIEAVKGDATLRSADELLRASTVRYVGFVEPDVLFDSEPHVVVTDGLLGNVVLKTVEATYQSIVAQLPNDARMPSAGTAGVGKGAVLLGVDGVVVKAHGIGTERGAAGAVTLATDAARVDLRGRERAAIERSDLRG